MKKFISYLQGALLVCAMALPIVGALYTEAEAVGPKCDYSVCPGGPANCCTQDGVTLYNWSAPPPPPDPT